MGCLRQGRSGESRIMSRSAPPWTATDRRRRRRGGGGDGFFDAELRPQAEDIRRGPNLSDLPALDAGDAHRVRPGLGEALVRALPRLAGYPADALWARWRGLISAAPEHEVRTRIWNQAERRSGVVKKVMNELPKSITGIRAALVLAVRDPCSRCHGDANRRETSAG
jgi:hypothetical protein